MEFLPEIVLTILSVLVIPVIIQLVKIWREKANPDVGLQKNVITIVAFVLSVVAAFIWSGSALPPFGGDPVEFIQALLLVASGFFTAVKALYDFLLKALFERLGWV